MSTRVSWPPPRSASSSHDCRYSGYVLVALPKPYLRLTDVYACIHACNTVSRHTNAGNQTQQLLQHKVTKSTQ